MGTRFDHKKQALSTWATLVRIARRFPDREPGIIRWTNEHVLFSHALPQYDAYPEVLFGEMMMAVSREFPKHKPWEIYVLMGVDMENGKIRYEFFVDGSESSELSSKVIRKPSRLRIAN